MKMNGEVSVIQAYLILDFEYSKTFPYTSLKTEKLKRKAEI